MFEHLISKKTSPKTLEAPQEKWSGKQAISKKFEGIRKEMD